MFAEVCPNNTFFLQPSSPNAPLRPYVFLPSSGYACMSQNATFDGSFGVSFYDREIVIFYRSARNMVQGWLIADMTPYNLRWYASACRESGNAPLKMAPLAAALASVLPSAEPGKYLPCMCSLSYFVFQSLHNLKEIHEHCWMQFRVLQFWTNS